MPDINYVNSENLESSYDFKFKKLNLKNGKSKNLDSKLNRSYSFQRSFYKVYSNIAKLKSSSNHLF